MAVRSRAFFGTLISLFAGLLILYGTLLGAAEPMAKSSDASAAGGNPGRASLISKPESIAGLLASKRIAATDVPNPHWAEDGCPACHRGTPTSKDVALRDRDIIRLCNACHEAVSGHSYIHAVGMVPSTEKRNRMNENLRQAVQRGGGVVTCITCHDVPAQCLPERRSERAKNPRFFRDGPFANRTVLCYSCHDPSHYQRLNPHDQISDEGELKAQVCLVCHDIVPNRREVKSIDDVSFNVSGDLVQLCSGCHPPRPHPAPPMIYRGTVSNLHLNEPRPDILEFIRETEDKRSTILPLDPTNGRIFCATCHNPHERGVQVVEKADRGADGVMRLRAGQGYDGCVVCHNM